MIQIILPVIVVVLSILAGYGYGHEHGSRVVQAKWDAENLALLTAQRNKESELQSNIATLRKAYTDETSKLSHTVAALNDRVRNRPERPTMPSSAASSSGSSPQGCTGAELYREDAAVAIAEAERADQIRLALIQCQAAYNAASSISKPGTQPAGD